MAITLFVTLSQYIPTETFVDALLWNWKKNPLYFLYNPLNQKETEYVYNAFTYFVSSAL